MPCYDPNVGIMILGSSISICLCKTKMQSNTFRLKQEESIQKYTKFFLRKSYLISSKSVSWQLAFVEKSERNQCD